MRAKAVLLTGARGVDRGARDASLRAGFVSVGQSQCAQGCAPGFAGGVAYVRQPRLAGPPLGGTGTKVRSIQRTALQSSSIAAQCCSGSSRFVSCRLPPLYYPPRADRSSAGPLGSTRSLTQRNRAPREDEGRPYFLSAGRP
jgi:hypothetical protein